MSDVTIAQAINNSLLDIRDKLEISRTVLSFKNEGVTEFVGSILEELTVQLDVDFEETHEDTIGSLRDTVSDIDYETKVFLQIPRLIESLQKINVVEEDLQGLRNVEASLSVKLHKVLKLEEYLSK